MPVLVLETRAAGREAKVVRDQLVAMAGAPRARRATTQTESRSRGVTNSVASSRLSRRAATASPWGGRNATTATSTRVTAVTRNVAKSAVATAATTPARNAIRPPPAPARRAAIV